MPSLAKTLVMCALARAALVVLLAVASRAGAGAVTEPPPVAAANPPAAEGSCAHDVELLRHALAALYAAPEANRQLGAGGVGSAIDRLLNTRCPDAALVLIELEAVTDACGGGLYKALTVQRDPAACPTLETEFRHVTEAGVVTPAHLRPDEFSEEVSRWFLPALAASCGLRAQEKLLAAWSACPSPEEAQAAGIDPSDIACGPFLRASVLRALVLAGDEAHIDEYVDGLDGSEGPLLVSSRCEFADMVACLAQALGPEVARARLARITDEDLRRDALLVLVDPRRGCDGGVVTCPSP